MIYILILYKNVLSLSRKYNIYRITQYVIFLFLSHFYFIYSDILAINHPHSQETSSFSILFPSTTPMSPLNTHLPYNVYD